MTPSSFFLLLLTSMLSGTLVQYGAAASSSTSTATSAAAAASASNIHQVAVGKNGLVFTPDTVTAAVGDTIEFTFASGHSVARSSFSDPCQGTTNNPIYSGFPSGNVMFSVKVNDTNPIWLYCSQVSHCQSGMVMVVNPPSSGANTLTAYKSAAANTGSSNAPAGVEGGVFAAIGAAVGSSSIGHGSAAASTASVSETASSTASTSETSASIASTSETASSTASTSETASSPAPTQNGAASILPGNGGTKWAVMAAAVLGWLVRV